jgi:hypothetical protein
MRKLILLTALALGPTATCAENGLYYMLSSRQCDEIVVRLTCVAGER